MFEDVIQLRPVRFNLGCDDPSLLVQRRGIARFLFSGTVSATPVTELQVTTPSEQFQVALAEKTTAGQAVKRLKKHLPRDVVATERALPGGIELVLNEATVPAARPPRVRLLSTDLLQRIEQLEENKVEFLGPVGSDCHLTLMCDNKRTTIFLPQGTSSSSTATRLAAHVPAGYRALVDGAVITIWKDADFFEMVA